MYQKFPYKFNQLNIKNYLLIILISFHLFFWDIKFFYNYGFREVIVLSIFFIIYKIYSDGFIFQNEQKELIFKILYIILFFLIHLILNIYFDGTILFTNVILGFFGISFLFFFVFYYYDFINKNLNKIILFFILCYILSIFFSDIQNTTEWEKTFLSRCALSIKLTNKYIFLENSHLGMVLPASLAYLLSISKKTIYKIIISLFFSLIILLQTSMTLAAGCIISLIFILIYDRSKFLYVILISFFVAILFFASLFYGLKDVRGNNCADKIAQTNIAIIENIQQNINKDKTKFEKENLKVPNEDVFLNILENKKKSVFKNYIPKDKSFENFPIKTYDSYFNLSAAVLINSIDISLNTLKERPLGWGLNRYETAFDYYMFNLIIIPPWYHEVYTLNYNDGASNFTKSLTEFGVISLLFLISLISFLFTKKINNKKKIFFLTLIITQLLRGAGYFNGGFAFCIIFVILTYLKKNEKY